VTLCLEELRQEIGDRPVTPEHLEAIVGRDALAELRRWYFPRWREHRIQQADEMLRAARTLRVDSEFEKQVVEALAPPGLLLRVWIAAREGSAQTDATTPVPG